MFLVSKYLNGFAVCLHKLEPNCISQEEDVVCVLFDPVCRIRVPCADTVIDYPPLLRFTVSFEVVINTTSITPLGNSAW